MYLDFTDAEQELRAEVRSFLDERLPAGWVGIWHSPEGAELSWDVTRELADNGWLTPHWPTAFGGRESSMWEHLVLQEEFFARHEPRGGQYMGVNWIGPVIIRYGTEEQKASLLPEIAQGRVQWAQLFSEPDAGSDLASLRTTAILDGDHFVVNGEKVWTSYANMAQRGFLLARSDPSAERHRGLSAFLIDMHAPGVEVREIPSTIGWHRFHSVTMTDVRVPNTALLGLLNGGWEVAMAALPFERLGNARYARSTRVLNLTAAAFDPALNTSEADQFAETLALGRVAELLNYSAAAVKERDGALGWQASAAFACNALYEREVAQLAKDVFGFEALVATGDDHAPAQGEVESFVALQAPTVTIQAGSYQVQLSIIGQSGLGLPRAR
jgi:alkylation response protein AidB-like acyl-CoA dehydrogenase